MSPQDSPESLYHSIPQVLIDGNHSVVPSYIELEPNEQDMLSSNLALEPVDSRIRWIHFILGCSVLLPWNVMITATPYFLSRLAGSALRQTFSSYLSITFTASNFFFLAHATAISKRSSPSRQTRITIILLSFLTLLLTLSTFFRTQPGIFFTFVLLNGALQAALGAYLQTSVIAIASLFGPAAVQAMVSGHAAVAVVVSGVQVVSSAIFLHGGTPESIAANEITGSAEEQAAFAFFSLSTLFLGFSALAHRWLISMPTYKTLAASLGRKRLTEVGTIEEHERLTSSGRNVYSEDKGHILRVARANIIYEISVAFVFVITLAVFPPITTSIQPINPSFHPLLFSAVHFLVFNLGDFLGRYICAIPSLLIWSSRRLFTLSLSRTLFVPLFLACNIQLTSSGSNYTPIINSDILFLLILFAFGLSNGYVSTLCLMAAPSLEHNPQLRGRQEDVDVAATVASFCLVGGLAIGSCASFAVRAVVCRCNPFMN